PTTSEVTAQKPSRPLPVAATGATAAPGARAWASAVIWLNQRASVARDNLLDIRQGADSGGVPRGGHEFAGGGHFWPHTASWELVLGQLGRCGTSQTARRRLAPIQVDAFGIGGHDVHVGFNIACKQRTGEVFVN